MRRLLSKARRVDRVKLWVTGCWVSLIILVGAVFYDDTHDEKQDCRRSLYLRGQQEEIIENAFRRLGEEFDAPDERIERFLDQLAADYEELPLPPACT